MVFTLNRNIPKSLIDKKLTPSRKRVRFYGILQPTFTQNKKTMLKPIYLDYAATTPVDPQVADYMLQHLTQSGTFANPASLHKPGQVAREVVENAREAIAAYLKADPSEVIFTSGATEAINLALKGTMRLYNRRGKHLITAKTEHKAVLDTCQHLEKEGYSVTYLTPGQDGRITPGMLLAAIRPDTVLVSLMQVNNETGFIQDVAELAAITAARGIFFHIDAAQSIGKVPLSVNSIPADLISLSAHKVYGPNGVGALYLRKRPRIRVEPLLHGGGHEQGMRSGTLPVHQIAGMGKAYELALTHLASEPVFITALRDQFYHTLQSIAPIVQPVHDLHTCVPHILNLSFNGLLADALLADLPGIATSSASACQGKGTEGSYVLRALGKTSEEAKSAIRFSFGRFTTADEISVATKAILALFKKSVE